MKNNLVCSSIRLTKKQNDWIKKECKNQNISFHKYMIKILENQGMPVTSERKNKYYLSCFKKLEEEWSEFAEVDNHIRDLNLENCSFDTTDWKFKKIAWTIGDLSRSLRVSKINSYIELIGIIAYLDQIYECLRDLESLYKSNGININTYDNKENKILNHFKLLRDFYLAHPLGVDNPLYKEFKGYIVLNTSFSGELGTGQLLSLLCNQEETVIKNLFKSHSSKRNPIIIELKSKDKTILLSVDKQFYVDVINEYIQWAQYIKKYLNNVNKIQD